MAIGYVIKDGIEKEMAVEDWDMNSIVARYAPPYILTYIAFEVSMGLARRSRRSFVGLP